MAGPLMKRPKADIGKVAIASAASPLNLGVLGVGTVGAIGLIATGSAPLGAMVLGLGVLAYGALIGLDLFSDKFIRKVYNLPDPSAQTDTSGVLTLDTQPGDVEPPELRALYQSILASHAQVRETISHGGELLQSSLTEAFERCSMLVAEAGRVSRRGNSLNRYLSRERPRALEADIERLQQQAKATHDQTAAKTFMQAADTKRQQLETYHQIVGLYDRIKAQLAVIESSIDGVQAKIIKLNATDPEEAASVGASLSVHLGALTTEMQVLESTVDETIKELSL